MVVNDQGLGVLGIYHWRPGAAPVVYYEDIGWFVRCHLFSLEVTVYRMAFAEEVDVNAISWKAEQH